MHRPPPLVRFVAICWMTVWLHNAEAQTQLPQPDPEYKGKIGETFEQSTPSHPQPVRAAEGSPNVLLILLDDVGFGMCSTFGGRCERHDCGQAG